MLWDPTSFFTALSNFFAFTEKLSPAMIDWMEAKIPAEKQTAMANRIRRCKRICRRQKLTTELITDQVRVLFSDRPGNEQTDISALITFELSREN